MLNTFSSKISHEVYTLLSPRLLENKKWNQIILQSLPWKSEDDTEKLFELRFTLLENGIYTPNTFYGFDKMSEINPERCLKLIDVILKSWSYNSDNYNLNKGIKDDFWHENIDKKVTAIADRMPEQVWDTLVPHLYRLTETSSYSSYAWDDDDYSSHPSLKNTCVKMIRKAAQILVKKKNEDFINRLQKIESSSSVILNKLFKECLYLLPDGYADYCLNWFLADLNRLKSEHRGGKEWELAAHCIRKHSCSCSENIFLNLERNITTYYEFKITRKLMKETRESRLSGTLFLYGEPQYFLLPSLYPNRRSKETNNIINMLQRRFKSRNWVHKRFYSGWVGSTLSPNINNISDKAWMDIVIKPGSSFSSRYYNRRQACPDIILESSVEQFSRSLEQVASQQPLRFSKLAIQFPKKTEHDYITAIYRAMSQTKAPDKIPEEIKKEWQPAPVDLILKFINKFPPIDEINQANAFCWLIRDRCEEQWPLEILVYIKKFAESHPDPGIKVECNSISDLRRVEINHTRGVAARATGALLFQHHDLFDFFRPTIKKLISDFHPAVRTAACAIILSLYNIDIEIAVNFYLKNIGNDIRIVITPHSIEFLNHTIKQYYEKLRPIILSIYKSSIPELQENAGKAIAGYNLFYDLFDDMINDCLHSTVALKKGMASMYCAHVFEEQYTQQCTKYLSSLFNDNDKEVRKETGRFLRYDFSNTVDIRELLINFIKSFAFTDNISKFLRFLRKKYFSSVLPFSDLIFQVCENLIDRHMQLNKDADMFDVTENISFLLFRLYDHSLHKRPNIAVKSLDYIDLLMQKNIINFGMIKNPLIDE